MNPLEFLKKAQANKEKFQKGKKGKVAPKEGTAEEEAMESPEEEKKEVAKGKGDIKDKFKGKK